MDQVLNTKVKGFASNVLFVLMLHFVNMLKEKNVSDERVEEDTNQDNSPKVNKEKNKENNTTGRNLKLFVILKSWH